MSWSRSAPIREFPLGRVLHHREVILAMIATMGLVLPVQAQFSSAAMGLADPTGLIDNSSRQFFLEGQQTFEQQLLNIQQPQPPEEEILSIDPEIYTQFYAEEMKEELDAANADLRDRPMTGAAY